ncbi:DoxX family protein [Candidatus Halobeggiatoa sp. HSG11]|nr:DoxX family protein [Candidatus Halobeggiatoa sp. HSG11]
MFQKIIYGYFLAIKGLEWTRPGFELGVRLYVAWIFFKSGLVKIQSWDTTVMLFEYEYNVPFLSPHLAAVLGTAAEFILPALFLLGLGGRLSVIALFVFNLVAVISYPDISPAGIQQHMLWGFMLIMLFFYGFGKLSLDHMISSRLNNY